VSESQKVEQAWETPSLDEIPKISRMHVDAMEQSDDDAVWVQAGMHHVLLRVVRRRSGGEQKVALPFWRDPDGNRVVVASFAGAPQHPAWYLNLTDRDANPEVLVKEREESYWADPHVLDGVDYDTTWAALTTDRPYYRDYQTRCDRRIPLVRLVKVRPA